MTSFITERQALRNACRLIAVPGSWAPHDKIPMGECTNESVTRCLVEMLMRNSVACSLVAKKSGFDSVAALESSGVSQEFLRRIVVAVASEVGALTDEGWRSDQ